MPPSKRIFDVFVSTILLFLAFPLMCLITCWVAIDSPGGPWYIQERVGNKNKKIQVIKFRTMKKNSGSGEIVDLVKEDDPRVTRAGKILRKLRIDELPQLLNVLWGDISLVGVRPRTLPITLEIIRKFPEFNDSQMYFGLTGLLQLTGCRQEDDPQLSVWLDLAYTRNRSFWKDMRILCLTPLAMVGFYQDPYALLERKPKISVRTRHSERTRATKTA